VKAGNLKVKQFVNHEFTSNTFLLTEERESWGWLIDIGASDCIRYLTGKKTEIKGVFLTHSHFDHILELNSLLDLFPDFAVYVSESGKEGLYSEKINLSFYHETPFIFKGSNVIISGGKDQIEITDDLFLNVIETPGHNPGCLTYSAGKFLFTGDSYIPGKEVVTKLKGGNIQESKTSLSIIRNMIKPETLICPGHGRIATGKELSE